MRAPEQRAHHYDPRLGHRRELRNGGEETAFLHELKTKGSQGWWVPNATVRHYVAPERMTIRYIRGYYVGIGRSLAKTKPRPPVSNALKLVRAAIRFGCLR